MTFETSPNGQDPYEFILYLLRISEVSQLVHDLLNTFRQLWISDIRLVVSDSDSVSGKPCPVLRSSFGVGGKVERSASEGQFGKTFWWDSLGRTIIVYCEFI